MCQSKMPLFRIQDIGKDNSMLLLGQHIEHKFCLQMENYRQQVTSLEFQLYEV